MSSSEVRDCCGKSDELVSAESSVFVDDWMEYHWINDRFES